MKLKCIIIDDESHAIEGLKSYISALPSLELIKTYTDPLQALKEITEGNNVDIIFMDVDMPRITGLELSKAIRHKTDKLIFTTAHTKYAFEAFEVQANAFLHKPYTLLKFIETVSRFFSDIVVSPVMDSIKDDQNFFFVRNKNDGNSLIKIRYSEIIAVESLINYVKIYTTQGEIVTYIMMSEIKAVLDNYPIFIQAHRSYIISKNYIEKVDGNTLKMSNLLSINIGTSFKDSVLEYIGNNTIKSSRN